MPTWILFWPLICTFYNEEESSDYSLSIKQNIPTFFVQVLSHFLENLSKSKATELNEWIHRLHSEALIYLPWNPPAWILLEAKARTLGAVVQPLSRVRLCDPMDCCTPGFPGLHFCLKSYPWSWWCHPAIPSSVTPFSSCPQSFPTSGSTDQV